MTFDPQLPHVPEAQPPGPPEERHRVVARVVPVKPPRSFRKLIVFLVLLVLVSTPFVVDQFGVRRVSGRDFPATDPMSADLKRHVERLASPEWAGRKPGTEGNSSAAFYLADAMKHLGLEPLPSLGGYLAPLVELIRKTPTRLGNNVIGYLPATNPSGPAAGTIVLGAHFDHIGPTNEGVLLGADDNASGVAVLLAAIAPLKAAATRRHHVIVVFFNTEEAPFFATQNMGSYNFAHNLPAEIGHSSELRLVVVLDLIGGVVWRHSSDSIFAAGAEKTPGLAAVVDGVREDGLDVRRLGIHMVENIPDRGPQAVSDYDAFRTRGIPFLFLSSGRTPDYHRPTDLPATLHYDRMARTARWIAKATLAVDAVEEKWKFSPSGADFPKDTETVAWFLDRAISPSRSIPGTGPLTYLRLLLDTEQMGRLSRSGHTFTHSDEEVLERAGFRLQCLLWSQPVCFTF